MELTRIVHSPLWSTDEHRIDEVREHLEFDVIIDLVRQSGIFAEIEISSREGARWIRVHQKDVNEAKAIIHKADDDGTLLDMANDRVDWW